MTPICTEHAALLRGVAKNMKDRTARQVYADWLQERGNAGWIIVANYPVEQWAVWCGDQPRVKHAWITGYRNERWRLPWLEGEFRHDERLSNPRSRAKTILLAYANGKVKI